MSRYVGRRVHMLLFAAVVIGGLYAGRPVHAQGMGERVQAVYDVSDGQPEKQSGVTASGTSEDGCQWEIVDKTLTIKGDGSSFVVSSALGTSSTPDPWRAYKDQIEKVVLEGVERLGVGAFGDYPSLSTVVLNEGLTTIGSAPFYGTSLKELTLPSTVKEVGTDTMDDSGYTFSCETLDAIYVDKDNQTFTSVDGVLYDKEKTKLIRHPKGKKSSRFQIPSSVQWVRSQAFNGCRYITGISMSSTVRGLGEMTTFAHCTGLRDIQLSSNLTFLPFSCFVGCDSLTEIEIPAQVKRIDGGVFDGCGDLKKITIMNRSCEWMGPSLDSDTVICGYLGSTAQEYARELGKKFVPLAQCVHKTTKRTVTPATMTKNGSIQKECQDCGDVSATVIYSPKTIVLSAADHTYNGKTEHPSVTVKGRDGKKITPSDYTVTYPSGCKNVGKYTVRVTFKGNYRGKADRSFTIKPKGTVLSRLSAGKKKITVKWKKQTVQKTVYQIQYSVRKDFKKGSTETVTVRKNSGSGTVLKRLRAGKRYNVRICTYKDVRINGKTKRICSAWSAPKSVTVKK